MEFQICIFLYISIKSDYANYKLTTNLTSKSKLILATQLLITMQIKCRDTLETIILINHTIAIAKFVFNATWKYGPKCRMPLRLVSARLFRYLFAIGPRYNYNKWMYMPVYVRACACTCVSAAPCEREKHRDV